MGWLVYLVETRGWMDGGDEHMGNAYFSLGILARLLQMRRENVLLGCYLSDASVRRNR